MPYPTLHTYGILHPDIIDSVLQCVNEAHDKHGEESALYGDDGKVLRILIEEVGEVAREMNELALGNRKPMDYLLNMEKELYQVASVALTAIRNIERRQGL